MSHSDSDDAKYMYEPYKQVHKVARNIIALLKQGKRQDWEQLLPVLDEASQVLLSELKKRFAKKLDTPSVK